MNNLETNALRIAELMGYDLITEALGVEVFYNLGDKFTKNSIVRLFSSYNGLMPIVFECNRSDTTRWEIYIDNTNITLFPIFHEVMLPSVIDMNYNTEPEFIEAIQECVIKYLELRNG